MYMQNFFKKSQYLLSLLLIGSTYFENHSIALPRKEKEISLYEKKSFISEALERSGPAIVTIDTKRKVLYNYRYFLPPDFLIDPYFKQFLDKNNSNSPQWQIERGQGSGIIFASEGLVLTNAHVVAKSDQLIVGLSDGRRVAGQVIGQDLLTDLAVIKLKVKGPWPTIVLGDSNNINVGDWAIAVGNPYGLEKTVTLGIISNLNRNISQLGVSHKRLNLIQTDAAIHPGNSGGPLLNSEGEVIGINTLIHSGPGAGLGFAIPINEAIKIASQLTLKGEAIHPMIGAHLTYPNLTEEEKSKETEKGSLVVYIQPDSPADKKGLKINDIILSVNDKNINHPHDVVEEITQNGIEKEMKFRVLRGNKELIIWLTPQNLNSFYTQ